MARRWGIFILRGCDWSGDGELNPKQCALLRIFGIKMARFTLTLDSVWEDGESRGRDLGLQRALTCDQVTPIHQEDDDDEELDEADLIAQGFEVEY
eukprot:3073908-Pyramimonas_sp.AAC.2